MTELVPAEPNKSPVKSSAKKSFLGIKEQQEGQLNELLSQVAKKLMKDMVMGRVGFFHDKKTGELVTEVYSLDLKSQKHPQVHVWVWKHFVPDRDTLGSNFRILFEMFDHYPQNEVHDSTVRSVISIFQKWSDPQNSFGLSISGSNDRPISHKDKVNLLKGLLGTEVDEEKIAKHFGRPYHKGDFVSTAEDGWHIMHHDGKEIPNPESLEYRGQGRKVEDSSEYSAYWVRDLWSGKGSLLDSGPLPEPKKLKE